MEKKGGYHFGIVIVLENLKNNLWKRYNMKKKLDLHGVRHEDARQQVINIIEDNWDTDNTIEVITGPSTRMKEILLTLVEEYKLSYQPANHGATVIIIMGD